MKGIVFLLVLVLLGWMAGAEYVWLCHVKGHCGDGVSTPVAQTASDGVTPPATAARTPGEQPTGAAPETPPVEVARTDPPSDATAPNPTSAAPQPDEPIAAVLGETRAVAVQVNGQTVLETPALRFDPGRWRIAAAFNGPDAIVQLSDLLSSRPELDAVITGEYRSTENNTSSETDLGLARAASIANALIDAGVARDRLTTASRRVGDDAAGPAFSVDTTDYSPILQTQLVMFPTGGVAPAATPELDQYVREVGAFLSNHRGASLRITGHTDNTGGEATNENLSLARARAVAEYLGQLGLPATRLRLAFRGQSEPVASNDTEAGRARNRRVEVQLELGRR